MAPDRLRAYNCGVEQPRFRGRPMQHEQPSPASSSPCPIWRWEQQRGLYPAHDVLAREEPLEIRLRGRGLSVTMRTPGHDRELAAGFLVSEGLIRGPGDVVRIAPCARAGAGEVINVFLAGHVRIDLERLTRHVFASSSCGLCGKATVDAICTQFPAVTSPLRIEAATLVALPDRLREAQPLFRETGGLHAAALFEPTGRLESVREDVGRHNAIDKVVGDALLAGRWPPEDRILLVSGRVSFEVVQKALAARIPLVAGVSAPSSLAVELARDSGQTLAGFLREGRMNLYAHPHRVVGA